MPESSLMEVTRKGNTHELTDEILTEKMQPFDFTNPLVDPAEISYDLIATMKKYGGIGLSANQMGWPYRVFVMHSEPVFTCFNPKIVDFSEETVVLEEGCLSFPYLTVRIKRARGIRARFTLPNGETTTMRFEGMAARVYQHELDHLDGILFYTRASLVDRRMAFKNRKLALRKQKRSK